MFLPDCMSLGLNGNNICCLLGFIYQIVFLFKMCYNNNEKQFYSVFHLCTTQYKIIILGGSNYGKDRTLQWWN